MSRFERMSGSRPSDLISSAATIGFVVVLAAALLAMVWWQPTSEPTNQTKSESIQASNSPMTENPTQN